MPDRWHPGMRVTDSIVDAFAIQVRKCKAYNLHFGRGHYTLDGRVAETASDVIVAMITKVLDTAKKEREEVIHSLVSTFAAATDCDCFQRLIRRTVDRVVELGQVTKKELYDDPDFAG